MCSTSYLDTQCNLDTQDLRPAVQGSQKGGGAHSGGILEDERGNESLNEERAEERGGGITKTKNGKASKKQSSSLVMHSLLSCHQLEILTLRTLLTLGQAKHEEAHKTCSKLSVHLSPLWRSSLTNAGRRCSSEAGLALTHEAAGSVDTHVAQLTATLLLKTALIYI